MVNKKLKNPPGEFGVSNSAECGTFSFGALTLLAGRQEGNPASKKLGVGMLVVRTDWSFARLCTSLAPI